MKRKAISTFVLVLLLFELFLENDFTLSNQIKNSKSLDNLCTSSSRPKRSRLSLRSSLEPKDLYNLSKLCRSENNFYIKITFCNAHASVKLFTEFKTSEETSSSQDDIATNEPSLIPVQANAKEKLYPSTSRQANELDKGIKH